MLDILGEKEHGVALHILRRSLLRVPLSGSRACLCLDHARVPPCVDQVLIEYDVSFT